MALTKVTNDLQDALAAAQPTITSTGTLTNFTSTGIDDNATSTAITIDASENVGIGTSLPVGKMHIVTAANGSTTIGSASNELILENNGDCGLTIRSSTTGTGVISFADTDDHNIGQVFYDHSIDAMVLVTNDAERMRIDSSGNVKMGGGTMATGYQAEGLTSFTNGETTLVRDSNAPLTCTRKTNAGHIIDFYNDTTISGYIYVNGSTTSYNTSSDYRLKEDDVPMTGATERVKALRPINFAWKVDGSRVDGFLAHEAQEVVPECATGSKDAMMDEEYEVTAAVYEDVTTPAVEAVDAVLDEDGLIITEAVEAQEATTESVLVTEAVMGTRSVPDMQGIDQSKLVPLLTAALQEAITKIEALTARIEALEA
jgi:hypothetical protein